MKNSSKTINLIKTILVKETNKIFIKRKFEGEILENFEKNFASVKNIEAELSSLILNEEDNNIQYFLFYIGNFILRRKKDFTKLWNFYLSHESKFKNQKSFPYLSMMAVAHNPNVKYPEYKKAYDELLKLKKTVDLDLNVAIWNNVQASFSGMVDLFHNRKKEIVSSYLQEALDCGKRVTAHEAKPKFKYEYARVLLINGDIDQASENVNKAISEEDSNQKNYSLRLLPYYDLKSKIEVSRALEAVGNIEKTVNKKIGNSLKYKLLVPITFVSILLIAGFVIGYLSSNPSSALAQVDVFKITIIEFSGIAIFVITSFLFMFWGNKFLIALFSILFTIFLSLILIMALI